MCQIDCILPVEVLRILNILLAELCRKSTVPTPKRSSRGPPLEKRQLSNVVIEILTMLTFQCLINRIFSKDGAASLTTAFRKEHLSHCPVGVCSTPPLSVFSVTGLSNPSRLSVWKPSHFQSPLTAFQESVHFNFLEPNVSSTLPFFLLHFLLRSGSGNDGNAPMLAMPLTLYGFLSS